MLQLQYFIFLLYFFLVEMVTAELRRIDELTNSDFVIGGLFPVHGTQGANEYNRCGSILPEKGIQRLEAMLFALDQINTQRYYYKFSLGVTILDTCSSDTHALEQSLRFLQVDCGPANAGRRVAAVVGAANSPVSESVASIFRLFKIPQVSYASTSEELDDLHKYPYFFRTVPSDRFQVRAIFDLLQHLNWTIVSAVAAEGDYGKKALEQLQDLARNTTTKEAEICFLKMKLLPREAKEKDYDLVIDELMGKPHASVVIVFLNEEKLRQLLAASGRKEAEFLWLGSDSWGAKMYPVHNQEDLAEGAITILPKRFPIKAEFDNYFMALKPKTNRRNPWFREFWENKFDCIIDDDLEFHNRNSKKICNGEEDLRSTYRQEGLVPMVVDSMYVIAHALRKMCEATEGGCEAFSNSSSNGTLLRDYIADVAFNSSQGNGMLIHFDKRRSIPVNYTIYQYRRQTYSNNYSYVPIGEWDLSSRLFLHTQPKWRTASHSSACSATCRHGEERVHQRDQSCCWTCRPCGKGHYLPSAHEHCTPCPSGHLPSTDKTYCVKLELEWIGKKWRSAWALLPSLFAAFGILCTCCTLAVFVVYRQTPIVMASGRELCYVILVGVILCYIVTFVVIAKPTKVSCGMLRVGLGLGLSVCYSAIFTKTNRISRIFNRGSRSVTRPSLISPLSQLSICLCLVLIQLTLSIMWMIVRPPDIKDYIIESSRANILLRVCGMDTTSLLLGLLYNMFLVVLCTVYAFKTRNMPENFNEAKYISFAMYSSCIVWLAFFAIYGSTLNDYKVQSTVLCISVSLSGTVTLLCLFFPKLYIVLFRPHKNVRYPGSPTNSAPCMNAVLFIRPSHGNHTLTSQYSSTLDHQNSDCLMNTSNVPDSSSKD